MSDRATKASDKRRSDGYNCKRCGGKKNIKLAQAMKLKPCICSAPIHAGLQESDNEQVDLLPLSATTSTVDRDVGPSYAMRGGGTHAHDVAKRIVTMTKLVRRMPTDLMNPPKKRHVSLYPHNETNRDATLRVLYFPPWLHCERGTNQR